MEFGLGQANISCNILPRFVNLVHSACSKPRTLAFSRMLYSSRFRCFALGSSAVEYETHHLVKRCVRFSPCLGRARTLQRKHWRTLCQPRISTKLDLIKSNALQPRTAPYGIKPTLQLTPNPPGRACASSAWLMCWCNLSCGTDPSIGDLK